MSGVLLFAAGAIRNTITPARISTAMSAIWAAGGVGGQWDFTDPATLFTDDAGTIPVSSHGHSIGRVADQSPHGLHLTQATAASRPTWQDSGGLRSAWFDGSGDFLQSTATAFDYVGPFTFVAGIRGTDAVATRALMGKRTNAVQDGYDLILQAGVPRMTLRGSTILDTTDAGFQSIYGLRKALAVRSRLNGVTREIPGTRASTPGTWVPAVSGQHFTIGRRGAVTSSTWIGDVYRAMIIGRELTDAEVGWAMTWCAAGGADQ